MEDGEATISYGSKIRSRSEVESEGEARSEEAESEGEDGTETRADGEAGAADRMKRGPEEKRKRKTLWESKKVITLILKEKKKRN